MAGNGGGEGKKIGVRSAPFSPFFLEFSGFYDPKMTLKPLRSVLTLHYKNAHENPL